MFFKKSVRIQDLNEVKYFLEFRNMLPLPQQRRQFASKLHDLLPFYDFLTFLCSPHFVPVVSAATTPKNNTIVFEKIYFGLKKFFDVFLLQIGFLFVLEQQLNLMLLHVFKSNDKT
jgi:hypothetical protein